ncbi:MAG TPA: hypothetical protein VMX17_07455 [Candidatus Glassbacteria bacterium]|nr:hypothetical protein [Candidatus Glassbacteria bacterium]
MSDENIGKYISQFTFPDYSGYDSERHDYRFISLLYDFCDQFNLANNYLGVQMRCVPEYIGNAKTDNTYRFIVFHMDNPGSYEDVLCIKRDGNIFEVYGQYMDCSKDIFPLIKLLKEFAYSPKLTRFVVSMMSPLQRP